MATTRNVTSGFVPIEDATFNIDSIQRIDQSGFTAKQTQPLDLNNLLVTGQFNSGIFGGIKDPAVLNYPDATGESLFNFDEAPLPDGLEWAWQLRPDGLTLMVVPALYFAASDVKAPRMPWRRNGETLPNTGRPRGPGKGSGDILNSRHRPLR